VRGLSFAFIHFCFEFMLHRVLFEAVVVLLLFLLLFVLRARCCVMSVETEGKVREGGRWFLPVFFVGGFAYRLGVVGVSRNVMIVLLLPYFFVDFECFFIDYYLSFGLIYQ